MTASTASVADVLVVDDDVAMASSLVEILSLRGIQAAAVNTASDAIRFEREQRPAVVISDQRLPDMTGLDLCGVIRSIDPDATLILLTGHASLDSAIAAVGQIDQYLTKPVSPDELVESVRAAARRTARRRSERAQALRINDSIVQYLVVAQARLASGDIAAGTAALDEGLARARGLIDDLLPEPAAPSEMVSPSPRELAPQPAANGNRTVVIVDDSSEIRELVRMLLEMAECFTVVGEAADGEEAITAAATHQPDLVLLDHSMPKLDGLTALPSIKETSPRSTVVMLSGFSPDRLADAALANGASAYLTKSDLVNEMVPALQRILGLEGGDASPS